MKKIKKHIIWICLITGLLQNNFGQEVETLLDVQTDFDFQGYFQLDLKLSELLDDNVTYVGIKGGSTINKKYGLGLTAGAFVTKNYFEAADYNPLLDANLSYLMGYTGLFIEYIVKPDNKIHVTIPLNIGPGLISLYGQGEMSGPGVNDEDLVEITAFMVIEPALNLEINIIKELKLNVGMGYRFVRGSKLDTLNDSDLSGLNINLGLRLSSY